MSTLNGTEAPKDVNDGTSNEIATVNERSPSVTKEIDIENATLPEDPPADTGPPDGGFEAWLVILGVSFSCINGKATAHCVAISVLAEDSAL